MYKLIIVIFFGLGCISVQAQKFSSISSDFSILEKNTLKDSSYLVVGHLTYNLYEDYTRYDISFPEKKSWEFRDSILTVIDSLQRVERIDTVGMVNELSIFSKILKDDLSDFGLIKSGFTIEDVQKTGTSVMMRWKPPTGLDFVKEIISKKDNKRLTGLIVIDENDKEISKTFYEDYIEVQSLPVPTRIKTHMVGDKEQILKEIQFRNVVIK